MKKSPFIVTISGDPLSGKTSAIDALVEKYEKEGYFIGENPEGKCIIRLATGKVFRDMAEDIGIGFQALGDFAKTSGNTMRGLKEVSTNTSFFDNLTESDFDKSVDGYLDNYMLTKIEEVRNRYEGIEDVLIIVDSRMAGVLMKRDNVEHMGMRFTVQPRVAAERLVKDAKNRRSEISIDDTSEEEAFNIAFESTVLRRKRERERFIRTHSYNLSDDKENDKVDLYNLNNYNLVIDTSYTTIEREIEILYDCIEKARRGMEYEKFWYSSSPKKEDEVDYSR
jgi:cytidylate kinase